MFSAIASLLGIIGSVISYFTGAQQEKIGQQQQKLADDDAVVETLTRERDAAATSDDAESAAKAGKF